MSVISSWRDTWPVTDVHAATDAVCVDRRVTSALTTSRLLMAAHYIPTSYWAVVTCDLWSVACWEWSVNALVIDRLSRTFTPVTSLDHFDFSKQAYLQFIRIKIEYIIWCIHCNIRIWFARWCLKGSLSLLVALLICCCYSRRNKSRAYSWCWIRETDRHCLELHKNKFEC